MFGELRSLLQRPPSAQVWQQLCALLEGWPPGQELEGRALPYCQDHLEQWPARLRAAPARWRAALERGEVPAPAPLVRHLKASHRAWSGEALATLLGAGAALEHLALRGVPLEPAHLEGLSTQPRLHALELWACGLDARALGRMIRARLPGLERLSLPANELGPEALARAAYVSTWPRLRTLDLRLNRLGDDGIRQLGKLEALGQLEALQLKFVHMTSTGLEMLVRSLRSTTLRELALGGNLIGPQDAERLASCAQLAELESLDLGHTPELGEILDSPREAVARLARGRGGLMTTEGSRYTLGPEGVDALLRSPHLRRLHTLKLHENALGPEGARALTRAPAPPLRALDVSINDLGEEGARALLGSPRMATLEELDLSFNRVGPGGLEPLGRLALGAPLWALRLRGNPLGAEGIRALREASVCARLEVLDLYDVGLDAAQVPRLLRSCSGRLRELDLSANALGTGLIDALGSASHLTGLERLVLDAGALEPDGLERLRAMPHLRGCSVHLHEQG